jgi:hypothetical protein
METSGGEGRVNQHLIDICFGVGLSVRTTAWVVGESTDLVWHEWSVRTGLPTPKDPVQSVIARRAKEVRKGWTEELRQLAECCCTVRRSSSTVKYRQRQRQEAHRRWKDRKAQEQQGCHFGSIDEKASPSPSPVMTHQMTLWSECIPFEAIG